MIKAPAVKSIISRFGSAGTLNHKSVAYDPTSGTKGVATIVSTSFVGVQQSDRSRFAVDSPFRTSEEVIIASSSAVPLNGDSIDWGNRRWTVRFVENINPTGLSSLMFTIALSSA